MLCCQAVRFDFFFLAIGVIATGKYVRLEPTVYNLVVFVFLDVFFKEKFLVLKKIVFFIVASSY